MIINTTIEEFVNLFKELGAFNAKRRQVSVTPLIEVLNISRKDIKETIQSLGEYEFDIACNKALLEHKGWWDDEYELSKDETYHWVDERHILTSYGALVFFDKVELKGILNSDKHSFTRLKLLNAENYYTTHLKSYINEAGEKVPEVKFDYRAEVIKHYVPNNCLMLKLGITVPEDYRVTYLYNTKDFYPPNMKWVLKHHASRVTKLKTK